MKALFENNFVEPCVPPTDRRDLRMRHPSANVDHTLVSVCAGVRAKNASIPPGSRSCGRTHGRQRAHAQAVRHQSAPTRYAATIGSSHTRKSALGKTTYQRIRLALDLSASDHAANESIGPRVYARIGLAASERKSDINRLFLSWLLRRPRRRRRAPSAFRAARPSTRRARTCARRHR
jgi:hypothetical protein